MENCGKFLGFENYISVFGRSVVSSAMLGTTRAIHSSILEVIRSRHQTWSLVHTRSIFQHCLSCPRVSIFQIFSQKIIKCSQSCFFILFLKNYVFQCFSYWFSLFANCLSTCISRSLVHAFLLFSSSCSFPPSSLSEGVLGTMWCQEYNGLLGCILIPILLPVSQFLLLKNIYKLYTPGSREILMEFYIRKSIQRYCIACIYSIIFILYLRELNTYYIYFIENNTT